MAALSATAKARITALRVPIGAFTLHHFPDGTWGGDSCGCTDDRCIGFHHDGTQYGDCGCLEVLLDEFQRQSTPADKGVQL